MDICQFAVWKSRNIESKYSNWVASDFEVSKYTKSDSVLFKLKYDIKNDTAYLYEISWVTEKLIDSCKFDDIDNLLKNHGLDN